MERERLKKGRYKRHSKMSLSPAGLNERVEGICASAIAIARADALGYPQKKILLEQLPSLSNQTVPVQRRRLQYMRVCILNEHE